MTSRQALIHAVLADNDPELAIRHDPILAYHVPVRDIVPR
jgi:hypothetical protein